MPDEPSVEEAVRTASSPSALLRVLLAESGYQVAFRANVWTECLVSRAAERWLGRGESEDEALADAQERMFPSAIARALLAERLAAMAIAPSAEGAITAQDEAVTVAAIATPEAAAVAAIAEPDLVEVAEVPEVAEVAEAAAVAADKDGGDEQGVAIGAADLAPASKIEGVAEAASPTTAAEDACVAPAKIPLAPGSSRRLPTMDQAPALEALEALRAEIERELPHVARVTAERQRLGLLVWICRARTFEEALPEARPVVWAVQRIARRLTEISKMFWPGSVRALQLATGPEETLELGSGERGHATWVEAAKHAELRLNQHISEAAAAGFDEDGWADTAARLPVPPDPEALLARVAAELDALPAPTNGAASPPLDVETILRGAQTLRWIRGSVDDHLTWGTTVGRLRRLLPTLGVQGAVVRKTLDPAFRPGLPWARVVMARPENEVRPDLTGELRAELDETGKDSEALLSWLLRAFDAFPTPDLAEMLRPRREQVAALGEAAAGHEDRRIRRRLRDLIRLTASGGEAPPPPSSVQTTLDAHSEAEDTEPDLVDEGSLPTLCDRVRPYTEGRRVLFVSNRLDHELAAKLNELLGVEITECEGAARRVEAQCVRIGQNSYDLVLSATGFQSHVTDSLLARATSGAGVPYVRVNRGRPNACVHAIAREFGLLPSSSNGAVARAPEING